jgi:branched-chain amino acid transport system permease protein
MWFILTINSVTLGGLLFLLSAGFSLIFGLMRIPNLTHGSFFMLGGYLGVTLIRFGLNFWIAAILTALIMALIGIIVERLLLRPLGGNSMQQVLLTLGLSFIIADLSLMIWTGDPVRVPTPPGLEGTASLFALQFPLYRLAVVGIAVIIAVGLWLMIDRTRLGAMIRAGVDDAPMARVVGIRVSALFSVVFALGAALAGFAGLMAGPYLSIYPGLDSEMLPLALIVVILGGTNSLLGALVGSFIIGFLFNFGQVLFPALAYVILFLPMLVILMFRPQGLFGRLT